MDSFYNNPKQDTNAKIIIVYEYSKFTYERFHS